MKAANDPFSLLSQLLRTPRPSALELAREREREKAREKKNTPDARKKTRDRMRAIRSKKQ